MPFFTIFGRFWSFSGHFWRVVANFDKSYLGARKSFFNSVKSICFPIIQILKYDQMIKFDFFWPYPLKSAIFDFVVKNLVFRPRRTANDYRKLTFDLLTLQKSNIRNIDQRWRSGASFEITYQIDPNSPDQRGYLGLVQELPIWIW